MNIVAKIETFVTNFLVAIGFGLMMFILCWFAYDFGKLVVKFVG